MKDRERKDQIVKELQEWACFCCFPLLLNPLWQKRKMAQVIAQSLYNLFSKWLKCKDILFHFYPTFLVSAC